MMAGLHAAGGLDSRGGSPAHRFTDHARARMRQRAVPALVLDWLDRFGVEVHEPGGVTVAFFDRRARRLIAAGADRRVRARLDHWLDAYAVRAGDGAVVTVGWRSRRVHRK